MKKKAKILLDKFSIILEFIIAGILIIGLLYFTVSLMGSVLQLPGFQTPETFDDLLNMAFTLVIGIEMVRMMCEHELDIVFEVLTFAIARQLVVSHGHAIDNLWGVASLGLLFLVKRFLAEHHKPIKSGLKKKMAAAAKAFHDAEDEE